MPLLDLTNQPADLCWQSHADILGPTAVDFSMLDKTGPAPAERALFKHWRKRDSARYSNQNARHQWPARSDFNYPQ